jgi:chaperone required for assembly of F1-ATPase
MPNPGDVYNPITDRFGPPPMAPSHTPEGIAQRQQAKAVAEFHSMVENRKQFPLKSAITVGLVLVAGSAICGSTIYLLEQLSRLP